MIPIVCIVGPKNSGKTTLTERLVRILTESGVRIATIKHDAHRFEVDHEGKDSYRLKHAGSRTTVLASAQSVFVSTDVDEAPSLETLSARYIDGVDLILAEGFKRGAQPKIEVSRKATGKPAVATVESGLIATAADYEQDRGVPHFELDDAEGVASFIRHRFLGAASPESRVVVRVNGEAVALNPFACKMFRGGIGGLIDALKLPETARSTEGRTIEIRIET